MDKFLDASLEQASLDAIDLADQLGMFLEKACELLFSQTSVCLRKRFVVVAKARQE